MSEFWDGFKDMFSEFMPSLNWRAWGEGAGIIAGACMWIVIVFIIAITYFLK